MSLPFPQGASTYRTVSVSSEGLSTNVSPTIQYTTNEIPNLSSYRTMNVPVSPAPLSHMQYGFNGGAVDGNVVYETVRYLVPVERRAMPESYVMVNSAPQMMSQPVSPVYLRGYSVSSQEGFDVHRQQQSVVDVETTQTINGKASSVFSRTPSPAKSPEPAPKVMSKCYPPARQHALAFTKRHMHTNSGTVYQLA